MDLLERLEAQPQAVHHAGTEVLHQDVGALHQLAEDFLAARVLEVDGDGAFPGVLRQEGHTHEPAVELGVGAQLAGQVAGARGFHLDDLGAHMGELVAAEGPGQHVGEVEDADMA